MRIDKIFLVGFLFSLTVSSLAQVDTSWVKKIDYANQEPVYGAGRLLAVDKAGNIYLGADGNPFGGSTQYVVAKYNSCGDTLWVKRVSGGAQGIPRALAVDDSGYVYVTGHNLTATGENYFTVKFSPTGDTLWKKEFSGTATSLDDNPTDIAIDKNGNVLVTGWLSVPGNYSDFGTVKYAPDGDTVWVRRYDSGFGNPGDGAMAMAVDTFGNVFVTGYAATNAPPSTEWRTIKYSPAGNAIWNKSYAQYSPSDMVDMEADASGNAYVCGSSYMVGGSDKFTTIKYAPNGDTLWVRLLNTLPADSTGEASAIEVDQSGNVYVVGSVDAEMALVKYDSNGNQIWSRRYPFGSAVSLALDKNGNIYVAGNDAGIRTTMFNPANGDTVWTRQYTFGTTSVNQVAVDTAGNVYVGGNSGNPADPDVTLVKYSSDPPCPPHGSAYTPAGTNVFVQPYPTVFVGFDNVSAPGITTVTLNPSGPTPPGSYTIVPAGSPVYYDITTTATYSDSISICLFYADSVVSNEDSLYLLHYTGSTWVDITLFHDKNTNQICGRAPSLSPFALAIPSACQAKPGDANADNKILLSDIVTLINFLFKSQPAPAPFCRGDVNGNGTILLSDVISLVNFLFKSGASPVKTGVCCL